MTRSSTTPRQKMLIGIHNINLMTNPTLKVTTILSMKMCVVNCYQHMDQV